MPILITSSSDIEWIYSDDATSAEVQLSNKPLEGNYFIECSDTKGNPFFTEEFRVTADANEVKKQLIKACPWLRDNITVYDARVHEHSVDGVEWILRFSGIKGQLNQFKIHSGQEVPL